MYILTTVLDYSMYMYVSKDLYLPNACKFVQEYEYKNIYWMLDRICKKKMFIYILIVEIVL